MVYIYIYIHKSCIEIYPIQRTFANIEPLNPSPDPSLKNPAHRPVTLPQHDSTCTAQLKGLTNKEPLDLSVRFGLGKLGGEIVTILGPKIPG